MGTRSRRRKIRRDDPFSGYQPVEDPTVNRAPNKDEKMSVSMKRFIALKNKVKMIENGAKKKKMEQSKVIQEVKNKKETEAKEKEAPKLTQAKQQKGESFAQFQKRLNIETKKVLIDEAKKTTTKRKKRDEFFAAKKNKKRKNNDEEDFLTFESLHDDVKFGDIVDRPPTFKHIPKRRVW